MGDLGEAEVNVRVPPHDEMAELSLIGAVLRRPLILRDLAALVDASDFYDPNLGHVWAAAMDLHVQGKPIDPVTVKAQSPDLVTFELLLEAQNTMPSVSAFASYADVVVDCSRKRRIIQHSAELIEKAYSMSSDIDQVMAEHTSAADRLIAPRSAHIPGLFVGEDFVRESDIVQDNRPWLIPHVMKTLWRTILVAGEGAGKAVLMRQLCVLAAAGRDPFAPSEYIDPVRCLYVDTENPAETITHQMRLACQINRVDAVAEAGDNLHIWHREGGINLRDRRTYAEFESVLQRTRPQIVFAGPLYKMYRRDKREDLEQAALEFTEILDDMRVRYDFGIMLEHHAPKAAGSGFRDLNPFGSSLFMRWPEIGLTMDDDRDKPEHDQDQYDMRLGRFRRDRVKCQWPNRLSRGRQFQTTAWGASWNEARWAKDSDGPPEGEQF